MTTQEMLNGRISAANDEALRAARNAIQVMREACDRAERQFKGVDDDPFQVAANVQCALANGMNTAMMDMSLVASLAARIIAIKDHAANRKEN